MLRHIADFKGLKVLFVQDEYDLTERLRKLIMSLDFGLVYTCVPDLSIEEIYPSQRFLHTKFVSTLTGFAPAATTAPDYWVDPGDRPLLVGYRGRALPFWYGDLGQEKQEIAERFRRECEQRSLPCDIEWDDRHRIYGAAWTQFMGNCRATLGTESGSNLFDDDGSLRARFTSWLKENPGGTYKAAREAVLPEVTERPLMNQISPRVFEAICSGTALVLYEGNYSGVVRPNEHYIPLRKDFANIDEVFAKLDNHDFLRALTRRAYRDVIESGAFSYPAFVAEYDRNLEEYAASPNEATQPVTLAGGITTEPERLENVKLPPHLAAVWQALPIQLRTSIYPFARAVAIAARRATTAK